ncbi:MAG: DUF4430 domain-containing protein [Clostridia bacterium]|nr:DUF4430 domain-containing protein [Clostridia bacterium]
MRYGRRILSIILSALVLLTMMSCCVSAAYYDRNKTYLSVRVEGISKTFYDDSFNISRDATVLDALRETGLDVVVKESQYGLYVSSIEGNTEKTFGGWDGWLFELNGEELQTSVDQAKIGDNVNLLVYYGDPYGVGMEYPYAEIRTYEGYITVLNMKFDDSEFESGNQPEPTPIVGATVTFDDGTVLTTDSEGKVYLTDELKGDKVYFFTIEKYAENGLPIVLRTHGWYSCKVESPLDPVWSAVFDFFFRMHDWFTNLFQKIAAVFGR